MSNFFEDVDAKYIAILRKLDILRARNVPDNDPELLKTRMALRDLLELKKRNSTAIQKVVPRLTGIKTIALNGPQKPYFGNIQVLDLLPNKYVMLGVVLGIVAVLYLYFKPAGEHS